MKARLPKGYGRPDPQAMMRQVQKMQDDIRAKQAELEAREYTGTASGAPESSRALRMPSRGPTERLW